MRTFIFLLALMPNIVDAQSCFDQEKKILSPEVLECLENKLEQLDKLKSDDLSSLKEDIRSLKKDFILLKSKIHVLNSSVDWQSNTLPTLKTQVKRIEDKLATTVEETQTQLATLTQKLTDLQAADTSLHEQVQQQQVSQQTQLARLEKEVLEKLATTVQETQTQLATLTQKLTVLEKPAADIERDKLATTVEDTQTQLATIAQQLTALQAANKSQHEQVQQQQVSQQTQLARLKKEVLEKPAADTEWDKLATTVENTQTQLATIAQKLTDLQAANSSLREQVQQQQVSQQTQLARLEKEVFKATPEGVQPKILDFCVRQGERCEKNVEICYGEPITIQWKTQYGDAALLTTQRGDFIEQAAVLLEDKKFFSSITQPMRFKLAVQNQLSDEDIRTVEETIEIRLKQPEITLAAKDDQLSGCSGQPVELHWAVNCAKEAQLNGEQLAALTGTKQFALQQPKTFTILATNGQQSIEQQLSFDLQKPVINYFKSTQAAGCYGEVSTLKWKTSCANQATLLRNGEEVEKLVPNQQGTFSLPITKTENLTLMTKSGPYEQSQELQISLQAPEIEWFDLTQKTACYDDKITAKWKARCASDVALTYNDGINEPKKLPVNSEGHYDFNLITPAADLSITATNRQAEVSAQQHITLKAPVIEYLRTNTRAGCFGDQITATWSASCLKDAHLSVGEDRSAVDAKGQSIFPLNNSKLVTLTATNGFQSVKQPVRLKLQEPVIDQFSVNQNQICRGDKATVSWQVSCASSVSLNDQQKITRLTRPLESLQGSTTIEIDQDTQLTLVASNGETEMEQTASITTLMPKIQAFSVDNQQICYGDSILANWQTQCADKVVLKQGAGTHHVVPAQQADFKINILAPQKLILVAQKGHYLDQKEIDMTLAAPKIDFFNATTAGDSSLDSLCFGESVNLAWQASCAKQVILMDQAVAENGHLLVQPNTPGNLVLQANNGIDRVTKKYSVAFQPPQITRFCGPSDVIFLGERYSFNWDGRCNAGYRLKSVEGPEQYRGTDNEATITLSSAQYQLTAHNHAGENPDQVTVDLGLKLTPKELIYIDLPNDSLKPFFITQYEVTQAEYQQCDSCNQYQPQDYQGLYCITRIDPANQVIIGQKGYSKSALACLSLDEAKYLIEGIEGFRYEPTPSSLGISNKIPANPCTLELGGSSATGLSIRGQTDYPVNCVSWQQAIQFANWRSQQEQLPPCYDQQGELVDKDCVGYRLPTLAEWQLAALGEPTEQRWFPWGDAQLECDDKGQSDCTFPQALPKGRVSKDRSPFGVQDMGLSLSEWTQDMTNYEGEDIRYAITRGHNWASRWPIRRYTSRFNIASERDKNEYLPNEKVNVVGFRLVRRSPKGLSVMELADRCAIDKQSPTKTFLVPEPIQPEPDVTLEVDESMEDTNFLTEPPADPPVTKDPFEGWVYDE